MRFGLKDNGRLIEFGCARGNRVVAFAAPIAAVACNRKNKVMMTKIVAALIRISAGLRGVQQSQAQHVIPGLVPTVFAVVKDGDAKRATLISYVRPPLRGNLVMIGGVVAALNRAET